MACDPAAVDLKGAGFLGQALAADDEPSLGFRQILVAQIGNGDRVSLLVPLLRGVQASGDIAEQAPRLAASLFRGQPPIVTDCKAARAALTIAVLDQERLGAARLHAKTEAAELVVPMNAVLVARFECINRALGEFHWCPRVSSR